MKFMLIIVTCGLAGIQGEYVNPCSDGSIDAATRTEDGSSYLFKGDYYWKTVEGGVAQGYPRLISDDWKDLGCGRIDAAFTWNDGSTFIFKKNKYWRFINKEAEVGYPKKISEGFKGIPNDVDAALVWDNNGMTYFFKGSQFWRYAQNDANPTAGDYPAPISAWKGVPNDITAAIRWENGVTYFFKGTKYYKYDNKDEVVHKDWPLSTSKEWFVCDSTGNFPVKSDTDGHGLEREISGDLGTGKSFVNIQRSISKLARQQQRCCLVSQVFNNELK